MCKSYLVFLASVYGTGALSISGRTEELISCLESSLSLDGSLVLPNDPSFHNDTVRFSAYDNPSFKVVSQVSNENDVRASINCAKASGTPFLITGPRHGSYTGFPQLQDGLEISTAGFNSITVDPDANTMIVGGSAIFKDVVNVLYPVGKNIPVGGGPCVGIVGAALGGGIGRLQGLDGVIHDSILSLRIMLPDTTVIEASATENADLFWGIRGAGFNFGFVLNATFRVYDAPAGGLQYNADFQFPSSAAASIYQALKDEAPNMPAPMCIVTELAWSEAYNETTIYVNAVYAGTESEGQAATRFLEDVGPALRQNSSVVPWNELYQNSFFLNGSDSILSCEKPFGYRNSMGVTFNEIDVPSLVKMTDQFNAMLSKYPYMSGSDNSAYFCATQAVQAVPDNTTSYPWRHALGHQTWAFAFPDATYTDATIEYYPERMRSTVVGGAGTDGLNIYVGFSNGDEPLESIFSAENLPHLAALKKQYDPDGLFNAYHPLPTAYP